MHAGSIGRLGLLVLAMGIGWHQVLWFSRAELSLAREAMNAGRYGLAQVCHGATEPCPPCRFEFSEDLRQAAAVNDEARRR